MASGLFLFVFSSTIIFSSLGHLYSIDSTPPTECEKTDFIRFHTSFFLFSFFMPSSVVFFYINSLWWRSSPFFFFFPLIICSGGVPGVLWYLDMDVDG